MCANVSGSSHTFMTVLGFQNFQISFNMPAFDIECPDHMKKCQSGKCLPKSFFCDGENDCDDKSDESYKSCGKINESYGKIGNKF